MTFSLWADDTTENCYINIAMLELVADWLQALHSLSFVNCCGTFCEVLRLLHLYQLSYIHV